VTDYLLKPFTFERFVQAIDRVSIESPKKPIALSPGASIFVKTENRLEKVVLREIIYIEGMRDYRRIHTISKRIIRSKPLPNSNGKFRRISFAACINLI